MTARAGRSRRQRCVTCTLTEWRAIKARARAEGMDASAYILARVLDGEAPDGPPHPEAGYPMALTGAEQRRQLELLERCVAGFGPLMQAPFVEGAGTTIGRALNFLQLASDACASAPGQLRPGVRPDAEPAPEKETVPGPEIRTANTFQADKPADARPRQGDLFENLSAVPPSVDDVPPRDLLDDVVDELNRDGDP